MRRLANKIIAPPPQKKKISSSQTLNAEFPSTQTDQHQNVQQTYETKNRVAVQDEVSLWRTEEYVWLTKNVVHMDHA